MLGCAVLKKSEKNYFKQIAYDLGYAAIEPKINDLIDQARTHAEATRLMTTMRHKMKDK